MYALPVFHTYVNSTQIFALPFPFSHPPAHSPPLPCDTRLRNVISTPPKYFLGCILTELKKNPEQSYLTFHGSKYLEIIIPNNHALN